MAAEFQTEACVECQGPFEFWGLSTTSKMYRCKKCQVVHFVPKGGANGVPNHRKPHSSNS